MTFLEILQDIYRRTNKPTTPEAETQTRIKAFVNQRHRTLLSMPGIDQMRDATSTFDSVADTPRVALPQALTRIKAMFQTDPNNWRLMEKSLDWLRTINPQQNSGTPIYYVPKGYEYVSKQPSDASAVYIKSSSASDTGTVYVQGIRTGGIIGSASQTMTGATAVQIGSFSDWEQIDKLYVSTAAVGSITLHEDSGSGTELAQISIGRYRPYYFVVLLWPTPAEVQEYSFDFEREILDLVNDTDEPYLPSDYHDLLSIGGRMDEYEKMDDPRYQAAKRAYDEKFASFQYYIHGRASERLIPRSTSGRIGYSDLGGYYPADGYLG
jgi:hypothetical protein